MCCPYLARVADALRITPVMSLSTEPGEKRNGRKKAEGRWFTMRASMKHSEILKEMRGVGLRTYLLFKESISFTLKFTEFQL